MYNLEKQEQRKENRPNPSEEKEKYKKGNLTKEQEKLLQEFLERNKEVFAKDKNDLGKTGIIKHNIDIGNAKPIKQRAYTPTQQDKRIIKEEVEKMLKRGITRKSKSPWASPVVIVNKKNGEKRFCIDYRKLNKETKKDNHPLPRIDDMLDRFQGSNWFTTIDLASGYWQVEMEEEDKEKTAFITYEGLYEYNVMPFGLCNAPATFQRLMHIVLGDLIYTKAPVYLDDVNIHSKTFDQHLEDLQEVFDKIREANLKIRLDKCHFCDQEIKFLGYIVGKNGIKTDEEKIKKVKEFPRPTTIGELKAFLGLASYYRRFIEGFSRAAKPLLKLTEGIKYEKIKKKQGINVGPAKKINKLINSKNITKEWGKEQEEAFQLLKEKLITAPILIYPNFEEPYRLYTDASGLALGAVLQQKGKNGKEGVIAYASKSLTKAEQNYSTTELECLAVIWAAEKFRHYLLGGKGFTIITDHYALKWLKSQEIKGRRGRWIIKLQKYEPYEIEYKEGKKHGNADAMSRLKNNG